MICDRSELSVNGVRISPSRGNCTTYNIIYLFIYKLCDKPYVGRTVNPLNIRTNQHRSAFYRVLSAHKNDKLVNSDLELDNESDDIYYLGMHIVIDHKLSEKGDFDKFYRVLSYPLIAVHLAWKWKSKSINLFTDLILLGRVE